MNNLFFSLEKLLNYKGNRYELARACMEYAKRVRYIAPEEYKKMGEKEALVALKHLLDGNIKYTSDPFEIEIYEDEASIIASQQEAQLIKRQKDEEKRANLASGEEKEEAKKAEKVKTKSPSEKDLGKSAEEKNTLEEKSDSTPA